MGNLNLPLRYGTHEVRTVGTHLQPEWIGVEVCAVLELRNPNSSLALLPESEKGVHSVDTPGGRQNVVTVTEAGLFRLIFKSRKPEAEAFKTWLCNDVLPCIRKYGTYPAPANGAPADIIEKLVGRLEHMQRQIDRMNESPAQLVAPAIPKFSVARRLEWRGLGRLTREARRKIHRIAAGRVEEHSEEPLCQAGGEGNGGPTYWVGPNIQHLDYAIDKVLDQIEAKRRDDEKRQPTIPFAQKKTA